MKNSTNLETQFQKEELLGVLTRLLTQRSGFYAKVILADLQNLGYLQGGLNNSRSEPQLNIISSSHQAQKEPPQLPISQLPSSEVVESKTVAIQEQIREKVVEIAAEKTGLPKEAIKLEYRLLDDLNLDSIKAGSLMAEIAKTYHLEGKFEPSEFANATLAEIIENVTSYLEESSIQNSKQNSKIESETTHSSSYVSSFSVELIKAELTTDVRDTVEKIAIACIKSHQELAENIAQLWDGFDIPDRLLILIPETWENLTETIEMLTNVAQKTAEKTCELGFIQFGNGYFSRCENNDPATSIFSVVSFAASLHLERPHQKIRVVEFDHSLSFEIMNQKIKAEFTTSDNYSVAGYNCEIQRHQMVYELAQKKSQSRNVNLTSEDVIIVTGGAKGITAECAIALAE
ncbi:MAG: phosphopantetheine-binding protein, partial [Dolichospermum sp.]